jgi:hypothetical protein
MRLPAGRRSLAQHRRVSASTPKSGRPGALTFGRMVSRSAFVVDVAAVASTTTSGHRRFRSPPAAADEAFVRALRSRTHLYQPFALFACRRLLSVRTSDFLAYGALLAEADPDARAQSPDYSAAARSVVPDSSGRQDGSRLLSDDRRIA